MTSSLYKHPRLYLNAAFAKNAVIALEQAQHHYLRNVLRKQGGDLLRLFNGVDGEWLARITNMGKKASEVTLEECVKVQPNEYRPIHLYFSPIKKQRMDILIEKAVELGVSDIHPVLMNRTVLRKLNTERLNAQIIEASEQCERMDIPTLYPMCTMAEVMAEGGRSIYVCLERSDETKALSLCDMDSEVAFLVGPEGGFDDHEIGMILANESVVPVSLGENILRAETAAIACLSYALLAVED